MAHPRVLQLAHLQYLAAGTTPEMWATFSSTSNMSHIAYPENVAIHNLVVEETSERQRRHENLPEQGDTTEGPEVFFRMDLL